MNATECIKISNDVASSVISAGNVRSITLSSLVDVVSQSPRLSIASEGSWEIIAAANIARAAAKIIVASTR